MSVGMFSYRKNREIIEYVKIFISLHFYLVS